jgi:hypothetical protein
MASRGSIPKLMALAGIELLPPDAGVRAFRRELERGAGGEVIVAGALGVLLEETARPVTLASGPMRGDEATITLGEGLAITTALDPTRQPFLHDHRIDGTPVLPGVMGMEAFAEAALALAPGYAITALEEVELQAPFKFYRDEPRTLTVRARMRGDGAGGLVADCSLSGRRTLATGAEQETLHFTGRVRLAREPLPAPQAEAPPKLPPGTVVEHDDVYRVYFHGPAYQVLEHAYRDDGHMLGRLAHDLPPDTEPAGRQTQIVPRLIELCFQTAGVWEIGAQGVMALPTRVGRLLRFAGADAPGALTAVVRRRPDGAADADVVDEHGTVRIRLEGYRTTPLPTTLDAQAIAPLQAVVAGAPE